MAETDYINWPTKIHFQYGASFGGAVALPASSVTSAMIDAANPIATNKAVHRHVVTFEQKSGTAVAAETKTIFIAGAAGSVVGVDVFVDTPPVGVKTFTVDVKKSTAGGAFATILSSVVTINSSTTTRSVTAGTLNGSQTFIDNDVYQVVIAEAGASGTQAQGVTVALRLDEQPT